MQFSHSRVECFENCPFRFKLSYLDNLSTLPNVDDPTNALFLGTTLHEGIEQGVKHGIETYYGNYPIISDLHVNEAMKLEHWIPIVREEVSKLCGDANPIFEYEINHPTLKGFIDLLIPRGNNKFAIYDFKYSNNVDRYLESRQLHEYKHFYESLNPTHEVVELGFIFVPKTAIRQKKTETLTQFRQRLKATLNDLDIRTIQVPFNEEKVVDFYEKVKTIEEATEFPKNETRLCDWCEFKSYCKEGVDYMLLPKNERRSVRHGDRKKLWIYGDPYSGKTTLANQFPSPLFLNTDGNITSFDAPFVAIKETLDGRQRVSAWDNFKAVIDELQKGEHGFKTVVVDLIEDCYEYARRHVLSELGLSHESEGSYGKAYKMVDDEFLTVFKKLCNLDYHIILLSHCDFSKEVTYGNGSKVTNIQPNIKEKIASKLTGYVDATGRIVINDNGRFLDFSKRDNAVGGGRLEFKDAIIPLNYEALVEAYETIETKEVVAPQTQAVKNEKTSDTQVSEVAVGDAETVSQPENAVEQPTRRTRRVRS